jgi:hypothetical protein
VVTILDKLQLDVFTRKFFCQQQGTIPGHILISLTMQQSYRLIDRDKFPL